VAGVRGFAARARRFGAFARVRDEGRHRYLIGDVGLPLGALPLAAPIHGGLAQSTVLFAMGRDSGDATAWLNAGGLHADAGRQRDPSFFADLEASMACIGERFGARRVLHNWPHGPGFLVANHRASPRRRSHRHHAP
jgi:hypothetical protein